MINFSKITYDVRPLLPRVGTYFESQADVAASYLFGSLASGVQPPLSDIDIGVLLNRHVPQGSYFERRLELMRDVAGILRTDEIDLLILNELPIPIAYHAIQPRDIELFSPPRPTCPSTRPPPSARPCRSDKSFGRARSGGRHAFPASTIHTDMAGSPAFCSAP